MKIAYIAPIRLPTERAHGYAIMKMCEEFARLGHTVELIVPNKWAPALKERDPFIYYKIERIFKLTRVFSTDFLGGQEGRGALSFWIDMLSFVACAKLFHSSSLRNAEIVYTRDFRLVPYLLASSLVLEVHDIPEAHEKFIQAVRSAKRIIAISHGLQKKIRELSGRQDVLVAPDAVDMAKVTRVPSQSEARTIVDLPVGKKIAMYAGHFYGWKGADVFAEAATKLPDVHCVLVGGVEPDFERLLEKYRNQRNLEFISFQNPSRIPLYLASADVLVLPNRSDSEISARYTSPLKLFEYMAAKRPIVASDLSSMREVLEEKTAILVKPDNPQALAEGVKKVLSEPAFASNLADAAFAKVQKYTWQNRAQTILDFVR